MNYQETIANNLALPSGLTSVGGYLILSGYTHPLPSGLERY